MLLSAIRSRPRYSALPYHLSTVNWLYSVLKLTQTRTVSNPLGDRSSASLLHPSKEGRQTLHVGISFGMSSAGCNSVADGNPLSVTPPEQVVNEPLGVSCEAARVRTGQSADPHIDGITCSMRQCINSSREL